MCNGKDDDCDRQIDEADAKDAKTWFRDADRDKSGDAASSTRACKAPVGSVETAGDCDDAKASVHPGAVEACDAANLDEDCNTKADDADSAATGKVSYYADGDGDGVGGGSPSAQCDPSAAFKVKTSGDCDDANPAIKPGATEVCDARDVDENCNGKADDSDVSATGKTKFYADKDADGAGAGTPATLCDASPAFPQAAGGDCNDGSAAARPGGAETCDAANLDEDCDGKADDLDTDATGKTTFYADKDLDKAGAGEGQPRCDASSAFPATAAGDCDDAKSSVKPGGTEVCDAANVDEDCDGKADDADDQATGRVSYYADADADGTGAGEAVAQCDASAARPVKSSGDCNDTNPAIKPGATEICDGANADENCNGKADDADVSATGKSKFYADKDSDAHGAGVATSLCDSTAAFPMSSADDCNDADKTVHPGASEVCDPKNLDEDCNGKADDLDATASGKSSYYADKDLDKYGAGEARTQCDASSAFGVTANGDCDDARSAVNPGGTEVCDAANVDEDCDGRGDDADDTATGRGSYFTDSDADGFGTGEAVAQCDPSPTRSAKAAGDCDDRNASVKPGATEVCDGGDADEDCDGKADDADTAATGKTAWYADRDADSFGAGAAAQRCDANATYPVATAGDCGDTNAAVNPRATELCDPANADEDCDGKADNNDDNASGGGTWYADSDGDKHGAGAGAKKCDATPAFPVTSADDCDDARANVHPAATEICDASNTDEDCDGRADDGDDQATSKTAFYTDGDKDGFGGETAQQCDPSTAFPVKVPGDCNDREGSVNPKATEVCDAADTDENCNAKADNADPTATGRSPYYVDRDDDSFGVGAAVSQCDATATAKATQAGDCNDANAKVNPGEVEVCDAANLDEDCSGKADNADPAARGPTSWYLDADRDSFGSGSPSTLCDAAPTHTAATSGDCDDANKLINPGATEVCDAKDVDEDCDSAADDADSSASEASKTAFYRDGDADGYGLTDAKEARCDLPSGYAPKKDDCDDKAPHVYPSAAELCDGAFDDCTTASRWTPASEDGAISARLKNGTWVDLRATFPATAPATATAAWAAPAGATLHVCAGTFHGRVTVAEGALTISGRAGAERSRLVGSGTGSVIQVDAGSTGLALDNLTITGGKADFGGAVRMRSTGPLTIDSCTFSGNTATSGGALLIGKPSTVTIKGSTFTGNTSTQNGGAIATAIEAAGGALILDGTVFRGNKAATLGGAVDSTVVTTVTNVTFEGNTAQDAAGLGCRASRCDVRDSKFEKNVATGAGGGLYLAGKAADAMSVAKSTFTANLAGGGGGAYFTGAVVNVTDSTFDKNSGTSGGGVLVDTGKVYITNTAFTGNIGGGTAAGGNGGGVYQSSGTITLDNATFTANEARPGPGRGDGGAIYAPGGTLTVNGGTLDGNRASGAGGGLYVGQATVTLSNTTISTNTAARGGGVYQTGSSSRVTAAGTTVRGNIARSAPPVSGQGGGWFLSAGAQAAIAFGSKVSENTVSTESAKDGVLGGGLALFGSETKFACKDSTITANNAKGSGAAGQTVLGGGAYLGQGGAVLSSASCEWGSDATDNLPADLWVDYIKEPYSHAGTSLPFTCTGDGRHCN